MRAFQVRGGLNQDVSDVFTLTEHRGTITCVGESFNGARSIGEISVQANRDTTMVVDLQQGAISIYAIHGEDVHVVTEHSSRGHMQERLKKGIYQLRLLGKDATFRIVIASKRIRVKKDRV